MLDNLRIGIIGGGEVVRSLIKYAAEAGLDVSVMGDNNGVKSSRNVHPVAGDALNYGDVVAFGRDMDMITVAEDTVDVNALGALSEMGVRIFPDASTLEFVRDKCLQKERIVSRNIPVVAGWVVANARELMTYEEEHTETNGQYGTADRQAGCLKMDTIEELGAGTSSVLEAKLDVKKEFPVIVSRNRNGVVECFDPALVIFDGDRQMADFSLCSAEMNSDMAMSACMLAARVAEAIDLTGTICVDLILASNGKMYVNDLSLRPCHSGLGGMKGGGLSEQERQLRAALELEPVCDRDSVRSVLTDIPELHAHRKFVVGEALKTVLCANDFGMAGTKKNGRRLHAFPSTDLQLDEFVSRAVVVKFLLGIG